VHVGVQARVEVIDRTEVGSHDLLAVKVAGLDAARDLSR
jgi:hypothetical protein